MKLDAHPKSMALIMLALGISGIGIILTIAFFTNTIMLGIGVTLGILGAAAAILGCIHRMSKDDIEFTKRKKKGDKYKSQNGIAPERIPSPSAIEHDGSFERADVDHSLYYEPCSVSPERIRGGGEDGEMEAPNHFILMNPDGSAPIFPEGSPNDFMRVIPKNDYLGGGNGNGISSGTPQQSRRANVQAQLNGGGGGDVLSPYQQRSFPVPQQYDGSKGIMDASPVTRRSGGGGGIQDGSEGYPHWSPQ